MQTITCLLCGRVSSAQRQTCLYCGETLPGGGQPAQSDPGTELAPELDRLVREAMKGGDSARLRDGDTARLRDALLEVQSRRGSAVTAGRAPVSPRAMAPAAESEPEPAPAPLALSEVLARLAAAAGQALRADQDQDPAALAEALRRVGEALGEATRLAPAAPAREAAPTNARQPPAFQSLGRHPFALIVQGRGDAAAAPALAAALSTDAATARQLALARHARLVARDEEPVRLSQAADAIERRAGLRASVVHRDELRAAPDPVLVLGLEGDRLRTTLVPVWLTPETTVVEGRLDMPELRLGVPGEIAVRRFRRGRDPGAFARRGATPAVRDLGEQRVHVLDLHGPGVTLRIVEGITDLRGLPGVEGQATLRSWAALLERAAERWQGLVMEGARICTAETAPPGGTEPEQEGPMMSSGWPTWEEHTRICRALAEASWR